MTDKAIAMEWIDEAIQALNTVDTLIARNRLIAASVRVADLLYVDQEYDRIRSLYLLSENGAYAREMDEVEKRRAQAITNIIAG